MQTQEDFTSMQNTSQNNPKSTAGSKKMKKRISLHLTVDTPEKEALVAFIDKLLSAKSLNSWGANALLTQFQYLSMSQIGDPEVISELSSKVVESIEKYISLIASFFHLQC